MIPKDADVAAAVDSLSSSLVDFLSDLVAVDSTLQSGEAGVQNVVFTEIERLLGGSDGGAFEVERTPIDLNFIRGLKGFSPVDWGYDGKYNVTANLRRVGLQRPAPLSTTTSTTSDEKGGEGRRSLILCGHADVVPATPADSWKVTDPFAPLVRDGRLYGRGSGDMKGGIACMVYALAALRRLGYAPNADVTLEVVCEEECTGNGCLAATTHHRRRRTTTTTRQRVRTSSSDDEDDEALSSPSSSTYDAVIIPEPFPFLVTAQLGVMWFRVTVSGTPTHVLDTSAGTNAIEGAYRLFGALKTLEEKYNEPERRHPAYRDLTHPVNFNLGKIAGGDWASSVPSQCTFEARVGFFPGTSLNDVQRDVEDCLEAAAKEAQLQVKIEYSGFQAEGAVLLDEHCCGSSENNSGEDEEDSNLRRDFVDLLQRSHRSAVLSRKGDDADAPGEDTTMCSKIKPLPLQPITCTTDCRFYKLYEGIPCVTCYGPEAQNIHGIDESVSLESVRDVAVSIALFVRDWCGLVRIGD